MTKELVFGSSNSDATSGKKGAFITEDRSLVGRGKATSSQPEPLPASESNSQVFPAGKSLRHLLELSSTETLQL